MTLLLAHQLAIAAKVTGWTRARKTTGVLGNMSAKRDLWLRPLPNLGERMDRCKYLLANPESLPLRDLGAIDRQRVVVVAPHPDDETLGCGGAISLLIAKGYQVKVLIVSDGTGSHPNSQKYPALALQAIRSQETIAALAILGVKPEAITFLRLKDGCGTNSDFPQFHHS